MADDKELLKKIVAVLDGESTRKIDFTFGSSSNGLHVSGSELSRVACLISAGVIKVTKNTSIAGDLEYDSNANTIKYKEDPRFDDPEFRGGLVHEAVHALVDVVKAAQTRRLAAEAAAYLAQALYLLHEVGDVRLKASAENSEESGLAGIYRACIKLIEKYRMATRVVVLPPQLYQPVLDALKSPSSDYRQIPWNQKSPADGVESGAARCAMGPGRTGIAVAMYRHAGATGAAGGQGTAGRGASRRPGALGAT